MLFSVCQVFPKFSLCPLILLCFKQAGARFALQSLVAAKLRAHLCDTTAQFIRPARELYGLRNKRRAKHLHKSSVIHRQAILDYLVAKRQKTPGVDFSVLAQGKVRYVFFKSKLLTHFFTNLIYLTARSYRCSSVLNRKGYTNKKASLSRDRIYKEQMLIINCERGINSH